MDYLEFERRLKSDLANLQLPVDARELRTPGCINPTHLLWTFLWCIYFKSDNRYVRVWERYDKVSKLIGESRRVQFALHYGPVIVFDEKGEPVVDELGSPKYTRLDAVDIRVDNCCRGGMAHLHYGAPDPHYEQDQVDGLELAKLDAFVFVQAVLRHRQRGEPLNRILGFRIL